MQNGEDELFSVTGENQNDLTFGGGKTGEENDNNDKDKSDGNSGKQIDMKTKAENVAKALTLKAISKFLCSLIDSSREKGFQNTDFSRILTNALCSSMHTLKDECLIETRSLFLEWLPTAITQLKCVEGPLKNMFVIWEIISKIKGLLEGRLTLRQLVKWLINKAVGLGILYCISYIFGPVGGVSAAAISVAIDVIKHLINRYA